MPLAEIWEITTEQEIPLLTIPTCTPVDPFGIDHDCDNPAGHQFVATCSDLVCCHCGRIAWQ